MNFELAREFIYRNARPVELAMWKFFMEKGSLEDVLTCLSFYQNGDGGFGHALEPDSFNPYSSPIQTWQATKFLNQIGFTDSSHPIIQGILHYLESGKGYHEETKQWNATVESHNDYPRAEWWGYSEVTEYSPNPTAALAGFIVRYAPNGSKLWNKGKELVKDAYDWLVNNFPVHEPHILECYIQLYGYLEQADATDWIDREDLKKRLIQLVSMNICRETKRWGKDYVALPSRFIGDRNSIFYKGNEEIVEKNCEFLAKAQLEDGSFIVPWQWWTDYKEYEIAANWWKSVIILENARFVKGVS